MSKREDFRNDLLKGANGFNSDQIEDAMRIFDDHFPTPEVGDIIVYTGEPDSILIGKCAESKASGLVTWIGITNFSIPVADCRRANADETEIYERRENG